MDRASRDNAFRRGDVEIQPVGLEFDQALVEPVQQGR
jgi:hypothetical protein